MFSVLKPFLKFFGYNFRKQIIFILLTSFVAGFLELIGITAILPILSFVSEPSSLLKHEVVVKLFSACNIKTNVHMFIFLMACAVIIFVIKNMYMIGHQYLIYRFLTVLRNKICINFMDKLLNCPYVFFLQKNSDTIINTLDNTVRYVVTTYVNYIIQFFINLLISFMLLSFMLYKFFYPSLVTFIFIIIFVTIQSKIIKRISLTISKDTVNANVQNINVLQQSMMAIKETKVLNAEEYIFCKFSKTSTRINKVEQLGNFIQGFPSFVMEAFIILAIFLFCCTLVMLKEVDNVLMTNLGLVAVIFFRLAPILNRASTAYGVIKAYTSSVESLNKEYEQVLNNSIINIDSKNLTPLEFKRKIQLKNVTFAHKFDSQFSLSNINLIIHHGEFIGIVGSSGAGKTTLVDIILGLLAPITGEYYIDDVKISTENAHNLANLFGYVSQAPYILSDTIAKNIAFGQEDAVTCHKKIEKVMKMAQLEEFSPDKMVMELGKTLSGGQKQRIAIARALYRNPKILVLDEATSALDIHTEHLISEAITNLRGEKTIITISHRLVTLKSCDRIIYMDDGRIVDIGPFNELKAKHLKFMEMIRMSNIA
ncbi:MAG: ABC transporter ATP-binding protein/permease [Puniceicoccales bacterium]|jgi:ATP-binding cassette subfamily C protein|nr:ABC transporter ATP-binding protein/permease [Puniceicoccales bacterium]